jgi:hypothetical protein
MTASPAFIRRTRDPSLPSPKRWEPVARAPGAIDIHAGMMGEHLAKWRNREGGR